jgi:hypothetical protein
MAFENLDFSGWKSGNSALARSKIDSETTYAKAHASQASGLTAGIGTIIGAIFGGAGGAALGHQIGGSLSGNGDVDTVSGAEFAGMVDDWTSDRSATKKKKNVFGQGSNNEGDIMQLASSYNMLDDSGNVKPTFLQFLDDIGYAG